MTSSNLEAALSLRHLIRSMSWRDGTTEVDISCSSRMTVLHRHKLHRFITGWFDIDGIRVAVIGFADVGMMEITSHWSET
jgi:hypothetical protein